MKKKLLSLLLTAGMVLGMASAAFAADNPDASGSYADETSIKISTSIVATGTDNTVTPIETFNYTVTSTKVEGAAEGTTAPAIAGFSISLAEDSSYGSTSIKLPEYTEAGVYYYEIKETAGNTVGITYDSSVLTLKVTVVEQNGSLVKVVSIWNEDGQKVDAEGSDSSSCSFTNYFNANPLIISKSVDGDSTEKYTITVEFSAPDGMSLGVEPTIAINAGCTYTSFNGTTAVFELGNGDSITFLNVPEGAVYTITEETGSYTLSVDGATLTGTGTAEGTMGAALKTVKLTNTLKISADTGVNLDSLPYVMILAVVLIGVVSLVLRRRPADRF